MKGCSEKTLIGRKNRTWEAGKKAKEVDHITVTGICEIQVVGFFFFPPFLIIYTQKLTLKFSGPGLEVDLLNCFSLRSETDSLQYLHTAFVLLNLLC